jgi:diketogulonate reductase-like aldo/keto reductase
MRTVALPSGERVPALGMGTWYMGESATTREQEIAALRYGLDVGLRLIDSAEMYANGNAEERVGAAIRGRRSEVFLVSKVYPHNATARGIVTACERSLERLGTDSLDLYLLHWRGSVPLAETVSSLVRLKDAGKIRHFGVSNLDMDDMQELVGLTHGGDVQTNQILYNLRRRAVELDLLPWLRTRRIPIMAYSPLEQGKLGHERKLVDFAKQRGMTAAQAALAWLLRNDDVIVIPKTARPERIEENLAALDVQLTETDLAELDRLFPAPTKPRPLEML